jgi:alpha-D-ribose 1-methylphosphonate 5-triphosphate diphosphatase
MTDMILTGARLVLRDTVLDGTMVVRGGVIADIQPGRSHAPGAVDCGGEIVIPGVIDLHTDNLERQIQPRATARWPSRSAMLAHDAQCAAAGVTTVYDSLCLGDLGFDASRMQTCREGIADVTELAPTGLLKAEHFLHLRCEMPARDVLDMLDEAADNPLVRMVSVMDHSPGVGQYANVERYRALRRSSGLTEEQIDKRISDLLAQRAEIRTPNRRSILARIATRVATGEIVVASHDDETVAEIAENAADGIRISEFPVTLTAALAAHAAGMTTIAGAPNIVRGGSHSGNVNAADLIRAGAVDALASDYVPAALIEAAFICAAAGDLSLPDAVALITDNPARMAHLDDRGRLEAGRRADFVLMREYGPLAVVREVWRAGERVA